MKYCFCCKCPKETVTHKYTDEKANEIVIEEECETCHRTIEVKRIPINPVGCGGDS